MARGDSLTSARSNAGGVGGEIRLLADKVGIFENSQVDASGDTGGGTVLVGGDYQGANPEIKNATVTIVGSDASITADALSEGDGGRVILWSDERTSYHGNVSVVGGEHSGDGGFVEVSSIGNLGFYGTVDTSAPQGEHGQVLLDPTDLTIKNGGGGSLDTPEFDDQTISSGEGGASETVSENALEAIVAGDITLQATNSITLANLTDNELTIQTSGTLSIEAGDGGYSTSGGGTDHINLNNGGSIVIDSTAFGEGRAGVGQITTTGAGKITIIAGADAGDELLTNAALATAGGAISLSGGGVVTTTSISSNGGAILLSGGGVVTIPSISSGGGDIDLVGSAFDITGNVDSGGGAINITLAGAAQLEFTTGLPSSDVQFLRAGVGTITFGVAGGVTASDILWDQTLDLTANGTTAGAFQFLADGGVNFTAGITTDKAITVDADRIGDGAGTFAVGAAMATGGQNLDVIADNVDLTAGINAGVGNVSITTSHEDTDIHLGVAGGGGTDLDITDAELGLITSANLELATTSLATGGDIFVDAVTQGSSAGITGTVTLTSVGSTISFEGAASEFSNSLNAQANNGITVSETLSTFAGNGGSITLNGDADDPTVGGADNVVIVSSDAAVVSISADGALNISGRAIDFGESATLSGAGVTLNATNTSITLSGADATTNKNTITSTGDANTISLTGGGVVVSPNNPDLILNSQGSLVLTNINIGDGTLTANIDTNNNGTESLTIGTGVVIGASGSAALNGGTDDNDTLVGSGTASVFALSATDSGTLTDGGETFAFAAFGGIDGGGGTDSLTGLSTGTSNWTIDADPTYVNGGTLDFTGIENLTGGASTDDFTLTVDPGGDIKGGAGDDSFAVNTGLAGMVDGEAGTADELSFGSAAVVTLTGSDADGFAGTVAAVTGGFDGINTLTGSGGTDTLIGDDAAATWGIDGAPTYVSGGRTLNFTLFENLTGGNNADDFTLTVDPGGDIKGGAGDDSFAVNTGLAGMVDGEAGTADELSFGSAAVVTLTGSDADGFAGTVAAVTGGFDGINTLTGSGGTDTLIGDDAAATWGIDGAPTYVSGGRTLNFTLFENLTGGNNADDFTLTVDPGGDIKGGAGDDSFAVNTGLAGMVDGEAGTADELSFGSAAVVTLTGSDADGFAGTVAAVTGGFDGINTLTGSGGTDTLIGDDAAATWGIDGAPTYVSGGRTLNFTLFENLTGGNNADDFTLTVDPGGDIKGGAGDDSFAVNTGLAGMVDGEAGTADELSFGSAAVVTLTGSDADGFAGTVAAVTGGFDGINTLTGSGGTDTLIGDDAAATWGIDGAPTYVSGGRTLDFTLFENLTGGNNTDDFTVTVVHTGDLTGGDGDDTFDIDATLTGVIDGGANTDDANFAGVAGALSLTIDTDLLNLETVVGNNVAGSRLIGPGGGNTWTITPADQGTVDGLAFSAFPELEAGAGGDTFNFNVAADNFSGLILGGAGDDQFIFVDDATISGSIDGAGSVTADGDVINFTAYTSATNVTLIDADDAQGFDGTATNGGTIVAFDNISTIRGASASSNTLTGPDLNNAWTLTAAGDGHQRRHRGDLPPYPQLLRLPRSDRTHWR